MIWPGTPAVGVVLGAQETHFLDLCSLALVWAGAVEEGVLVVGFLDFSRLSSQDSMWAKWVCRWAISLTKVDSNSSTWGEGDYEWEDIGVVGEGVDVGGGRVMVV